MFRDTKVCMLALALALLTVLTMTSANVNADVAVQVTLSLNEKDVTYSNRDATVLFYGRGAPDAGQRSLTRCAVGAVCDIPPGEYWLDIESLNLVVETRPFFSVPADGPPGPRSMPLHLRVTPAARIEIPGGKLPVGAYLSAVDQKTGVLHSRKVDGPVARVRVPARPVILCGFEADGRPIGCERVDAREGQTVALKEFRRLANGRGQLFVGLLYPGKDAPWDAELVLQVAGSSIRPDGSSLRGTHYYAIWYDVPAGAATLSVKSKFWTLGQQVQVNVPERETAAKMKVPLLRKPLLKVSLSQLEGTLGAGPIAVTLLSCEKHIRLNEVPALAFCGTVAERNAEVDEVLTFADLEPLAYALKWKRPPFENASWIDLRDGASRELSLRAELYQISGRVTQRGRGISARIHWEAYNRGGRIETESADDGTYSLSVAQNGRYFVLVGLNEGRIYSRDFEVDHGRQYEIEVPGNRVAISVADSRGDPIPNARVRFEVRGLLPQRPRESLGERTTRSDGRLFLPPLPLGELEVTVDAAGYRSARTRPLRISDDTGEEELNVTLTRGAGVRIRVIESSGLVAVNAPVWSGDVDGVTGADGVAVFEEAIRGGAPLVTFDSRGCLGFFRYLGEEEQTLQIPRCGPPILVRFQAADGIPLPHRNVFVGVEGVFDTRRRLLQALAAGGDPYSRQDGTLRVGGLPFEGTVTVAPYGRLEMAVVRSLPLAEEVTFTLPVGE